MNITYEEIKNQAMTACGEIIEAAKLNAGDILVVGASSSEVMGMNIGKGSDINAAEAIYEGITKVLEPKGIYLAAQCCEHLNRAVIVEKEALPLPENSLSSPPPCSPTHSLPLPGPGIPLYQVIESSQNQGTLLPLMND